MKKIILAIALLVSGFVGAKAQDKATVSVGADLVSSYVWRGVFFSGASLQPTMSVAYKGLSIGAWGSTDIIDANYKEFDMSAFYTKSALKVGLTHYWWSGKGINYFGKDTVGKSGHYLEGTVGYVGSKFALTWNTIFLGDKDKNEDGDQMFSTYVEGAYNFNVGDIALTAAVGVSPWESNSSVGYHYVPQTAANKDGFQVSNISLKAVKTLKISDSVSIPVYVQGIVSPAADQTHLVVGVTF